MKGLAVVIVSVVVGANFVSAQSCAALWAQCGGSGHTGPTCCVAGSSCVVSNQWYSQCLPGNAASSTKTTTTTVTVVTIPTAATSTSTSSSTSTSTRTTTVSKTSDVPTVKRISHSPKPVKNSHIDQPTGNPGVLWVGRVNTTNASGPRFSWQGSGFVANVAGSTIAIKLRADYSTTEFFQPVVDGVVRPRIKVAPGADTEVVVATGLSSGNHRVEFYRDTEAADGFTTFLGFTAGTVKSAPAAANRRIEIVGDSISAGYGNLGVEPHPNWVANPVCHYSPENSTWYQTYGAIAGRAFGAEVSTVARSGWGIVHGYGGDTNAKLPLIYDQTVGVWFTDKWTFKPTVDAVAINLGTNDWSTGDPGTTYETLYLAFLKTIRANYPNAYIFLTIGPMLGASDLAVAKGRLSSVVSTWKAQTSDTKIAVFDYGTQNLGSNGEIPSGCDWHPSLDTHKAMAETLKAKLSAALGW
ncbi:SGNH hydrolase-type esterase domain-containing protein [Cladochytrium replicatum]|nr:SGNH hydrolase-type esterase domain-containing protein [Cladochytrium replicatum]